MRNETHHAGILPGAGVVARAIQVGTLLGSLFRFRVPASWWIPNHVGGESDGMFIEADGLKGMIATPMATRLRGLVPEKDYRIVRLAASDYQYEKFTTYLASIIGRPYQAWPEVAAVYRDGNHTPGDEELFCSEAMVRALARAPYPWATRLPADNTDPLELYMEASRRAV